MLSGRSPLPVVIVSVEQAARFNSEAGARSAPVRAVDFLGIGIKKNPGGVKGVAGLFGRVRSLEAIAVAQVKRRVAEQDVPDVAGFVNCRIKGDFLPARLLGITGNDQRHGCGVAGEYRKN